jgi:hypothetical protein
MSQRTRPQVVRSYLAELESALAGVPADVARDILDGVAEELAGLDSAAAATRIEELGDPVFIASEARAESRADASAAPRVATPASLVGDPRWYIVVASLLVAVGGVVVPLIGWVFGIAMVWMSKTWHGWEKWVATLSPLLFLPFGLMGYLATSLGSNLTWWHLTILSVFLMPFVTGLWLLWRGLRRRR